MYIHIIFPLMKVALFKIPCHFFYLILKKHLSLKSTNKLSIS